MTRCRPGRLFFLLPLLVWSLGQAAAETERSFGVVPQQSTTAAAQRWQPLLNHLVQQTGTDLRFATASTITEFEERCLKGSYDYIYVNPLLYQELHRRVGYRALVRDERPLEGIIVVRADGPQTLAELSQKTLAFPAPRALGATLLTRADLKQAGVTHGVIYLGSHESAYQAVLQGEYIAAGGVQRSFDLLPEAQRRQLRILHRTRPVMSHVIAVHPRVPAGEMNRLRQELLQLPQTTAGAALLKQAEWRRLVAVKPEDFASLQGMVFPPRLRRVELHAIPRQDQASTQLHLQPMAAYLRQWLELEVELHTYQTMEQFEKVIYRLQRPALVIANPMQALRLAKQGHDIIAQERTVGSSEGVRGTILVRDDSPYHTLADLKGKRIAFGGSQNAFFASIVPRTLLKRAGLAGQYQDASEPGPVAAVLPRLLAGEIDAAGAGTLLLHSEQLREKYPLQQLRILAQSEALPGLAWLVGPRFDPDMRQEIIQMLVQFGTEAPGHAAMRAAGIERMLPANATSYRAVAAYLAELNGR